MKNKMKALFKCKKTRKLTIYFNLLLLLVGYSCSDDKVDGGEYNPNAPVEVSAIIPKTGTYSIPLVIHGKNFGTDKSKIKVYFDEVEAVIITAKNEQLYVLNPSQEDGQHTLKVVVDGKEGSLKDAPFTYVITASVTTVAGHAFSWPEEPKSVDGPALEAGFNGPNYIAADDQNNLLVVDDGHSLLRLVSLQDNKVTTLLDKWPIKGGSFSPDFAHFYAACEYGNTIMHDLFRPENWQISSVNDKGDFEGETSYTVADELGNIYLIGIMGQIAKMDPINRTIKVMGNYKNVIDADEDSHYIAYNPLDKHLYISCKEKNAIYRVDTQKETFTDSDFELYAGKPDNDGNGNGNRLEATFKSPCGIAFDKKGNMYVADYENALIRKISPAGVVSTFAGTGDWGHADGRPEDAKFLGPRGITVSPKDGFVYVADTGNHRIRCISVQ